MPVRAYPYNVFPHITLAWLIIGAAVVIFAPHLAKRMGDGLTHTLGIPELGGPHHRDHDAAADSDLGGLAEDTPPTA